MRKILLASWIIITLLLGVLLVLEKIENKTLILEEEHGWKVLAIHRLPHEPGAYVLWQGERVLHIGQTGNLHQRITWHKSKYKKELSSFDWYRTKTSDKARLLEKQLKEELGYQGR